MPLLSVAIETSCRRGQICLGQGDSLLATAEFEAGQRHATHLVARLDQLLAGKGFKARDLNEIHVSIGPGSFTGLRVGITVARTLAQAVPSAKAVAVPTLEAVVENAAGIEFENLGVLMDAKEGTAYLGLFARRQDPIAAAAPARLVQTDHLADQLPRPILLIGEALGYCTVAGEGIEIGDQSLWLPSAEGVWRVGRRMAAAGQFTDYPHLLPLYLRKPEAVRLWDKRHEPAK